MAEAGLLNFVPTLVWYCVTDGKPVHGRVVHLG